MALTYPVLSLPGILIERKFHLKITSRLTKKFLKNEGSKSLLTRMKFSIIKRHPSKELNPSILGKKNFLSSGCLLSHCYKNNPNPFVRHKRCVNWKIRNFNIRKTLTVTNITSPLNGYFRFWKNSYIIHFMRTEFLLQFYTLLAHPIHSVWLVEYFTWNTCIELSRTSISF